MINYPVPDGPTQLEIFRKMALLKANDERSRKVISTGRLACRTTAIAGRR